MKRGLPIRTMVCPPKFQVHIKPPQRSLHGGEERKGAGSGGFCWQKPRRGARSGRRISLPAPSLPTPGPPGGIPPPPRAGNNAAAGTPAPPPRRPPLTTQVSAPLPPAPAPPPALAMAGASAHRPRGRGRRSRLPAGRRAPLLRTDRSARRAPSGAAPSAPSSTPRADARPSPPRRPRRAAPSNSRRGGRVARA